MDHNDRLSIDNVINIATHLSLANAPAVSLLGRNVFGFKWMRLAQLAGPTVLTTNPAPIHSSPNAYDCVLHIVVWPYAWFNRVS